MDTHYPAMSRYSAAGVPICITGGFRKLDEVDEALSASTADFVGLAQPYGCWGVLRQFDALHGSTGDPACQGTSNRA